MENNLSNENLNNEENSNNSNAANNLNQPTNNVDNNNDNDITKFKTISDFFFRFFWYCFYRQWINIYIFVHCSVFKKLIL